MKALGKRMLKSNIPAMLIIEALLPFLVDFTGGMHWQKLVNHFATQAKDGKEYSVAGIGDWDLNAQYPTSRILYPILEVQPKDGFSMLVVKLNYAFNDRFLKREKDITMLL